MTGMPRITGEDICNRLRSLGDPERARSAQRYFKTGPGQYGEGDLFVGLRVPEVRALAKEYRTLSLAGIVQLLHSPIHEARLLSLMILIGTYEQGDPFLQERIYNLYLRNTRFINNWDLVDVSAERIVGAHLSGGDRFPLHSLAESPLLWERRIAVIATAHFIRRGEFDETFRIAERLLGDSEDLIHKAVGWMLREIGKRDRPAEEVFLRAHYKTMPRTMLRYAIERFPEELRQRYLRGEI